MLRIAIAQINVTVGDLPGNQKKILEYLQKAKMLKSDMVVFPELALTGYPPEDLLHKEHFVRDNLKVLKKIAFQVKDIIMVVGFVDIDRNKNLYNAAAVIAKGKVRGVYHKHDLPNYGVFDEKRYFAEGNQHPLFLFNDICFGVNICEDIWQDEGIYLSQAQRGASLLINISSSPYDYEKLERRERLLSNRAKESKAYICYANLVGGQDELVFDGGSFVVSPRGRILARAEQFNEDMLVVDLPIDDERKKRRDSKQFIQLPTDGELIGRIVAHKNIMPRMTQDERIFKALILGTRDYVWKNGFKKVVIGLSGGIDSSLVAVIAREAVGCENVIGITMPSPFSSPETRRDAQALAENLGIEFKEIAIKEIYEVYLKSLSSGFAGLPSNVAEENLQARVRGNILMAFSNKFGWLLLTTGNKSEIAVGYCTLYGDMSGGFAVIKDLPKGKVYEISRLANNIIGPVIPESVFDRPPSAELRPNQKDQDSLPPYEVLDKILKMYVEDHRSCAAIVKKFGNLQIVKDVIAMVDRSEYKRRQAPPGIKITPRAFGKDWRLPMTNKYREA
ncbi:MAG: NAD+ synthase [Candidatus Omnitrophica bacterium]|nr:NAD+ synthase [Candidatus Omnitrophota bacterium]